MHFRRVTSSGIWYIPHMSEIKPRLAVNSYLLTLDIALWSYFLEMLTRHLKNIYARIVRGWGLNKVFAPSCSLVSTAGPTQKGGDIRGKTCCRMCTFSSRSCEIPLLHAKWWFIKPSLNWRYERDCRECLEACYDRLSREGLTLVGLLGGLWSFPRMLHSSLKYW